MRRFRQLELADRALIAKCRARRLSVSEIARVTGFHKATISRELRRNEGYYGGYWSAVAQHKRNKRNQRATRKRATTIRPDTWIWIKAKLRAKWSPEQIAGRSKIDGPQRVSHEAIYLRIRKDRRNGGRLYELLRRAHKHRYRPQGKGKPKILNRMDISTRPTIVNKRIRLGDLEGI